MQSGNACVDQPLPLPGTARTAAARLDRGDCSSGITLD